MTLSFIREVSNYLQWSGSIIVFLCCLPLLSRREHYIKVLLLYSLSSIVFQLAQQVAISFFKNQSVNQIGNGFVFFEAVLLGLMFLLATGDNRFRKIIAITVVLYILYYSVAFLFFIENAYSYIRLGRDLLMILFAIVYFYYLLRKLPEDNLLAFPMFWINASILFFFSGTFILSFFRDYIVVVLKDDLDGFWAFRNFFRFGFCLVLAYAVWLDLQQLRKRQFHTTK